MRKRAPIKVLTIGHSYAIALNRSIVRELAKDASFAITIVTPRVLDGNLRRVVCEPEGPRSRLEVIPIDASVTHYANLLEYDGAQLSQVMAQREFDIVHAWIEPWTLSARQVVALLGRRTPRFCFWTYQNLAERYPRPFAEIERRVVARADAWMAATDEVRRLQIARGYPAARAHVVPPAVDTTRFHPTSPRKRAAIRRELTLDGHVIGYAGRLVEEKGLDIIMRAIDGLDGSVPWTLLLMGSGPYEIIVRRWARRRRYGSKVRLRLLKHEDVPRYLAAVDVLLVPSQTIPHWREQCCRAAIEAMSMGVPVIASDSGVPMGCDDAVRVVAERDLPAWTSAIETVLADTPARRALSRLGRVHAKRFSTQRVAADCARVFRSLRP